MPTAFSHINYSGLVEVLVFKKIELWRSNPFVPVESSSVVRMLRKAASEHD